MATPWNLLAWFQRFGAFRETLDASPDRGDYRFWIPEDSRHYLGSWTRSGVNQKAEWIWQNFGVVKDLVAGIARHTVGKGISLQIDSEDAEWNSLAEQDFERYALTSDRCDLAGRRSFYEAQATAVEQWLIRGEFFAALTENPEWNNDPAFQLYDAEEIRHPVPVPEGYDPEMTVDGVLLNQNARAVGYWLSTKEDPGYTIIPRAQMVHWYKPHAVNQPRGVSQFAQAINPLVDVHELKKLATRCAKAQQLLALALKGVDKKRRKGAFGAIENAKTNTDGTPNPDALQYEKMMGSAGGGIIYLDDKDGDAKLISSSSPSPLVESFITDLLLRDVCLAPGVPSEFFWNADKLNGGNTRFIIERADLFFKITGDRLSDKFCNPIAFRYLSRRIEQGKLRPCADPEWPNRMSWMLPARPSIDNGRDQQILIELLANGAMTLRDYCNARGIDYRATMRQWIREPIQFLRMAEAEGADSEYLQRLRENLPLWRAPQPGQGVQQPTADAGAAAA
jgi:capsid protein